MSSVQFIAIDTESWTHVAYVCISGSDVEDERDTELEGMARLFKASPRLLIALRGLLNLEEGSAALAREVLAELDAETDPSLEDRLSDADFYLE